MRYKLAYHESKRHLHVLKEGDQLEGYAPITEWESIDLLDAFKDKMNEEYLGLQACSPNNVPSLSDIQGHWESFRAAQS